MPSEQGALFEQENSLHRDLPKPAATFFWCELIKCLCFLSSKESLMIILNVVFITMLVMWLIALILMKKTTDY